MSWYPDAFTYPYPLPTPWASHQIRKIVGCACAGNTLNVFPATDLKTYALVRVSRAMKRCFVCRIKSGHSNLESCFGPRVRALAKVFYRGESRGKISCLRPNPQNEQLLTERLWSHSSFLNQSYSLSGPQSTRDKAESSAGNMPSIINPTSYCRLHDYSDYAEEPDV